VNQDYLQILCLRTAIAAASCALFILIISAPGCRLGWWGVDFVYTVPFRVSVAGGAVALLAGLAALGFRAGASNRTAGLGALAALVGVAAAVPPAMILKRVSQTPEIHDLSTDLRDPPVFVQLLQGQQAPAQPPFFEGEKLVTLQQQSYPDLKTIRLRESEMDVFDAALAVVGDLDWNLVATDRRQGRIEATGRSAWFGLHYDQVIRIIDDGSVTRVDIRSRMRNGGNDLGMSAARIRNFRHALNSRLSDSQA
jgi:hypothetical protein